MSRVLVITSSALGDASVSNKLVREAVKSLQEQGGASQTVTRDLGAEPIPHMSADFTAALHGAAATDGQRAVLALSDTLIAELRAADTIVIGAPMYNFGMPSTLKAWFDHVLRAGVTFRYTEAGAEGLLTGKRAIVIESRGGLYSEGPAQAMDSQEPHLRTLLGFMGITDVTFVRAEKLAFGPEAQEQAIAAARATLAQIAPAAAAA